MKLRQSFFLVLPLFLCSCTDNGLLLRSNGAYLPQDENVLYMVGDSYEIQGEVFTPAEDYTYIEEGYAGWFDYDKNHLITQNGEIYKKDVYSGMHRTLPLPSLVKVTNLENNEAVIVRVNDRGPMVKNRIIDVSKEAAEVLKLNKDKATKVLVEIMAIESQNLKKELLQKEAKEAIQNSKITLTPVHITQPAIEPAPLETPKEEDIIYSNKQHEKTFGYVIQIGAFKDEARAHILKETLKDYNAFIIQKNVNNMILNCVQIGGLKTKKEALISLDKLKSSGYPDARIISKQ